MSLTFGELAVGARFRVRGRVYVKHALSLAEDEKGIGTVFLAETVVEAVAEEAVQPGCSGAANEAQ
jgi:hypothetical protein